MIAYLHLKGPRSEAAVELRRADDDWCAPWLWRSEFRNVLAGEIRRGALEVEAAIAVFAAAQEQIVTVEADAERVLYLIAATRCSAYDLEFVALAQQLGVELVTLDHELLRAFPGLARPLN